MYHLPDTIASLQPRILEQLTAVATLKHWAFFGSEITIYVFV